MSTPVSSASQQVFAPSVPYKTRPALFSHQRLWPTVRVQPSSARKAVKVVQVRHKWQSNHYKVGTELGVDARKEELVSPQTNRVISTFRGSPSKRSALWEFDLSESVWSHEMWGQTRTMGKGTNGRAITGLQAELHFKRGQMAFSSLLKALSKSDVMHKRQPLCWLTDIRGQGLMLFCIRPYSQNKRTTKWK